MFSCSTGGVESGERESAVVTGQSQILPSRGWIQTRCSLLIASTPMIMISSTGTLWNHLTEARLRTGAARAELFETCSNAVKTALSGYFDAYALALLPPSRYNVHTHMRLDDMSKLVAVLHPKPGDEILTTDSLDESVPRVKWIECVVIQLRSSSSVSMFFLSQFSDFGRETPTWPC